MKETIVKNIGVIGKRALVEVLLIRYFNQCRVDYSISLSIGHNNGLGISLLCSKFMLEINLLPLITATHVYYLENG